MLLFPFNLIVCNLELSYCRKMSLVTFKTYGITSIKHPFVSIIRSEPLSVISDATVGKLGSQYFGYQREGCQKWTQCPRKPEYWCQYHIFQIFPFQPHLPLSDALVLKNESTNLMVLKVLIKWHTVFSEMLVISSSSSRNFQRRDSLASKMSLAILKTSIILIVHFSIST